MKTKTLYIIFFMFGISIIAVGIGRSSKHLASDFFPPSEVIKNYYQLSLDGKVNEALLLWTESGASKNSSVPNSSLGNKIYVDWTKMIKEFTFKITKIDNETIDNNTASVLITIESKDGYQRQLIYKLEKIDNNWKINTFSSPILEETDKEVRQLKNEKLDF